MGFYIRKSVSLGPIRFNLSKSGVGISAGVKGARIGIRPNGTCYLHGGRYGLYAREELGRIGGKTDFSEDETPSSQTEFSGDIRRYESEDSIELSPASRIEMLTALRESYCRYRYDYLIFAISGFVSLMALATESLYSIFVVFSAVAISIYVANAETKKRTYQLIYEFDDGSESRYIKIIEALNFLSASSSLASVKQTQETTNIHEWKQSAGASELFVAEEAAVGTGIPPWVESNIDIGTLKVGDVAYYFLPDGLLVYDATGVGFVEYTEIEFQSDIFRNIVENPPNDATIVDSTWKHPNKSGGPDRRFSNNYEIPICEYSELFLTSESGLMVFLKMSNRTAADSFCAAFQEGIHIP